jgi:hypothetical protein
MECDIYMNKTQHKSETHTARIENLVKSFLFLSRYRRIFTWYCTGNMLIIVCKKFGFLSNNCLAKKLYFFMLFYTVYRHYAVNFQKKCEFFMLLYTAQALYSQFSKKLVVAKFGQTFHNQYLALCLK